MKVHIASYNIQYGFGMDGNFDPARTAAALEGADILALQEVTRGFPRNGGADLVARLGEMLPGRHSATGMAVDIDAGSSIDNGRVTERRFQFGNMVMARWPVLSRRNHLLPRRRASGPLNLQRGALDTVIATPAGVLRIICVHLDHVDAKERMEQVEALQAIVDGYTLYGGSVTGIAAFGHEELPVAEGTLVMGDFNFEPDSAEYAALSGSCHCRLVDISAADDGISFHDPSGSEPDQRIDYVFADTATAMRITGFRIDRNCAASDHFPLHFDIQ
jgi:endonuclease/exonuclease/phosphatase family metal-dependent hydrolase